jgi:spore germination protein GerM
VDFRFEGWSKLWPPKTKKRVGWVLALFLIWKAWHVASRWHVHNLLPHSSPAQNLYTGKEPKAKVAVTFVSSKDGSPQREDRQIYRTASRSAQAKQVVLDLLAGPSGEGMTGVFPQGSTLKELYLSKGGLCVVDFGPEVAGKHPGGSTGEYLTLSCLVRSLCDNFPEVKQVQVLIDGQVRPTLAGHYDISDPMTRAEF